MPFSNKEELTSAEVSFASEELLDGAGVGTDFPEEVDTIVDQGAVGRARSGV